MDIRVVEISGILQLREVFYKDGTPIKNGHLALPHIGFSSLDEIREELELISSALEKPILNWKEAGKFI